MKNVNHIPHYNLRRYIVFMVFAMAIAGLLWRALSMQVVNREFFKQQGDARQLRVVTVPAHRGDIYDRNGEPLAISTPVDTVWLNPVESLKEGTEFTKLAEVLGLESKDLKQKVNSNSKREFLYVKRHVDPELGKKVQALKLPGVYLQREYKRYYPAGEVASHLIGFSNVDDVGQEGIELAYEEWLRGVAGSKKIIRDRLGRAIDDVERIKSAEAGKSIYLSIDRRIQYLAYRTLKAAVKEHGAVAGSAVILDVTTGEVLAMVNQPSFNANDRRQLKPDAYRNRAVTDVFEPGSTMKPITVAAALETGKWHEKDNVRTSPGYMRVQGNTIKDIKNYGKLDIGEIILKSSNVGISKIALSISQDQQLGMYQNFGFGFDTGSGYPGESSGSLNIGQLGDFERAAMAFGYGVSVTPLQLVRAYAAIANDGVIFPASFIKLDKPPQGEKIISQKTAKALRSMMQKVVSSGGTGFDASVPNYHVAGKTGTVHKFIAGGYAEDRYLSIFAGMAPASNPRLAMVVMLNEPSKGEYFGGQVAGPVFSKVMSGAMRLLNIAPDDLKIVRNMQRGGQA
ncbi:MAG: penicillin-binding transpeptidase domain-containing protein [Gammaproteobacteria bacterium]|nr:penicillin-binding transpeptidase domain-containing protein [Gammaproteobacteria bacterium]